MLNPFLARWGKRLEREKKPHPAGYPLA